MAFVYSKKLSQTILLEIDMLKGRTFYIFLYRHSKLKIVFDKNARLTVRCRRILYIHRI